MGDMYSDLEKEASFIDLAEYGIEPTAGKQYNEETDKNPIHNGKLTGIFFKWLMARITKEKIQHIERETLHSNLRVDLDKKSAELNTITASDLQAKIKDHQKQDNLEVLIDKKMEEMPGVTRKGAEFLVKKILESSKPPETSEVKEEPNASNDMFEVEKTRQDSTGGPVVEKTSDMMVSGSEGKSVEYKSLEEPALKLGNLSAKADSKQTEMPVEVIQASKLQDGIYVSAKDGKSVIVKDDLPQPDKYPMQIVKDVKERSEILIPSEDYVLKFMALQKLVKTNVVDKSDYQRIGSKDFLKKSGWRKFISAFKLSVELIEKKVYKFDNDLHAEVRVRVITMANQSVEGLGIKSKSEYYSEKYDNFGNYNLHNLISTAYTRAVNRAVSDLVGFGEVSAEEVRSDGGMMD